MTLVLRWRKPDPAIVTQWRGLDEATKIQAASDNPKPIAAVIGPPGADFGGYGYQTIADATYTALQPLVLAAGVRHQLSLAGFAVAIDRLSGLFAAHAFVAGGVVAARADDDTFDMRLTCQGKSEFMDNRLRCEIDIGGSQGVIAGGSDLFPYSADATGLLTLSLPMFSKTTFLANGGNIFLTPQKACELWDFNILVRPGSAA